MELPNPPEPVGDYQAVIIRRGIGFVSGQFPLQDGALIHSGKIGSELSEGNAIEAIRLATYNVLAQISQVTDKFKKLDGILRLEGHLACSSTFNNYVKVLDESSRIFNKFLGEKGAHSRALFIHERLPLNSPVELCVSFYRVDCYSSISSK